MVASIERDWCKTSEPRPSRRAFEALVPGITKLASDYLGLRATVSTSVPLGHGDVLLLQIAALVDGRVIEGRASFTSYTLRQTRAGVVAAVRHRVDKMLREMWLTIPRDWATIYQGEWD